MKTRKTTFITSALIITLLLACQTSKSSQTPDQNDTISRLEQPDPFIPLFVQDEDMAIFRQTAETFRHKFTCNTPLHEIIPVVARHFLATPYVAFTLEIPGDELLVVNLREMDCTTYVEYIVALSMTIKDPEPDFLKFSRNLAMIRYRDGRISGYPSRLHYFTEWMHDNAQKGIIEIISNNLASNPFVPSSGFMSKNANLYRQLENLAYIDSIIQTEKIIASYSMKFIPKDQISRFENQINDGDIIAFTTSIAGLDVSHTGFALHIDSRLHLLHASTRTHQVEITTVPLSEYLKPMNRVTGILVARAK